MKRNGNLVGIALASLITMNGTPVTAADQVESSDERQPQVTERQGENAVQVAARQKLVDALKSMKNNPEAIEFHSAMCYKMAMPPAAFDHSCPTCGHVSALQYHGLAGRMAREMSGIRRSLPNLAVQITVDETALCEKCSKGRQPELVFTTQCGNCPASFTWKISTDAELEKLEYLFINFPATEINLGPGRFELKNPAKVREIVEYVSGCMFCPSCIEKLQLKY